MSDAHPADGLVPFPQDEYPPDWHDDGQAAHQLALERQERATEILQRFYRQLCVFGWPATTTVDDLRFLCAELGLDWADVIRR